MLRKTKGRLLKILFYLSMLSIGIWIILYNLQENIIFFYPPSKINEANKNKTIKVGGFVKSNSIVHLTPQEIKFVITDDVQDLTISYVGLLPALFREGQGIIASGRLIGDNLFQAAELLTKHDENYMPPEIAKTLNSK